MRQLPLAIGADPAQTFDNYVSGQNRLAVDHLRQSVLTQSTPAFLWGPSGSGKTHLMRAVVSHAQQCGARVSWFDPERPLPWVFDESAALIVLDDCEKLDETEQHAAFALFVQATAEGIPVVGAAKVPPVDLPIRDDLRTRLGWGHVFAIQPLAEAEARAALRREADRRGLFLSDDVMDHLLTRFARDLKHLMALLDRLDGYALVHKRAITVPLLKQMLAEQHSPLP